jgi:type I restriction enzyme S subunit
MAMKADSLLDVVYSKSTGTANQANIGMDALNNWVIPLPPLAEQHRIVAKVDELMTLCEQLKTKLQTAQTLQQQLAQTLVQQAVA